MRDVDYCSDPQAIDMFPDVHEALRILKEGGYKLIVITNQSGIGRGYFTEEQYRDVEAEISRQIGQGVIDATYFCPHGPDQICGCRKPEPGMVFQAAHDHGLDLARSFFIGDKDIDMQCGRRAGVKKTVLVQTGYGQFSDSKSADYIAPNLTWAAHYVIENRS